MICLWHLRFKLGKIIRWLCVAHHFKSKRSKLKGQGHRRRPKSKSNFFQVFATSTMWSRVCFERFPLYVAHIHPMRWRCVTHHFQVKRSQAKVTGSFKRISACGHADMCWYVPTYDINFDISDSDHLEWWMTLWCHLDNICMEKATLSPACSTGVTVTAAWVVRAQPLQLTNGSPFIRHQIAWAADGNRGLI